MLALRFDGSLKLERHYPKPEPAPGEALVRVTRVGLCETDLEITRGYMQFTGIPGHEFVGVVEAAPSRAWVGKRVTAEINCSCGRCELCQSGLSNHCPFRTVIGLLGRDGALAEYLVVPERNLHEVPPPITEDEAVFIEPLAAAMQVLRQVRIEHRSRVVVLGDGKLGNLVAQVLKPIGCELMVVGKHPEKLGLLERLAIRTELASQVKPRRQWDVAIDCTGSSAGLIDALKYVRARGTIVLKTTVADPSPINLSPLVVDEITLLGSRCGPFAEAIHALAKRSVDVIPLIDEIYRLRDAPAAFQRAAASDALKVIVAVDEAIASLKKFKEPEGDRRKGW